MATYAIGDVQGCYQEFCQLLEKVKFDPSSDRLWLLGDLVNRGPANLDVVRLVMSFGSSALTVFGNHDLHLLAICLGGHTPNRSDTFHDILEAPDLDDIVDWYRQQSFLIADVDLGYVMTHAGIPHIWSLKKARKYAAEVEGVVRGKHCESYFRDLYGNKPNCWSDDLEGMDRWRMITNYFTRMRLMDEQGVLNFSHKGGLEDAPGGLLPWYDLRAANPLRVTSLFGHWAAIEGETGHDNIIALDTGCVWGRELTAMCLETGKFKAVSAA